MSLLDRQAVTDRESFKAYLESVYDNIQELDTDPSDRFEEHEPYFSELKYCLTVSINELQQQPSEELRAEIVDELMCLYRPVFTTVSDLEDL